MKPPLTPLTVPAPPTSTASVAPLSAAAAALVLPLLFDTHCHCLKPDESSMVRSLCVVSTSEEDWEATAASGAARRSRHVDCRVAYGVHPWWAAGVQPDWEQRLRARLLASPSALVGECGLDGLPPREGRPFSPMPDQLPVFAATLRLAAELSRPVSLHCVRAPQATRAPVLRRNPCCNPCRNPCCNPCRNSCTGIHPARERSLSLSPRLSPPYALCSLHSLHVPWRQMLETLAAQPALPPVLLFHAYCGSIETARQLTRPPWHIGLRPQGLALLLQALSPTVAGSVTHGCRPCCVRLQARQLMRLPARVYFGIGASCARSPKALRMVAELPAERLLLETDQHSDEAMAVSMLGAAAVVGGSRGWSLERTAEVTTRNAKDALDPQRWGC